MDDATHPAEHPADELAAFWERRYSSADRVWSGRVNPVLAEVTAGLTPGTAVDLGCGEGGDAIWLVRHGWQVTGVDVSATAIERGRRAAHEAGIDEDRLHLVAADLATWHADARFDLVTASYLHSWPVPIDRAGILRTAAGLVTPGGHLLITAHAERPPWAGRNRHGHGHEGHRPPERTFPTPESDVRDAVGDASGWHVEIAETRRRSATGPDGQAGELIDSVVLLRRSR